jgi:16S rRNA (guanine527-N7)-methyltransferase
MKRGSPPLEQDPLAASCRMGPPRWVFFCLRRLCTLSIYLQELQTWNARVNLTGLRSDRDIVIKGFLDSLAVLPFLHDAPTLADLGSGAGFPGLALKLARPDLSLTLVESRGKKAAFLEYLAALLGLSGVEVVQARLTPRLAREWGPRFAAVTSRAAFSLEEFLTLAAPLLLPGGRALALKGAEAPLPGNRGRPPGPGRFRPGKSRVSGIPGPFQRRGPHRGGGGKDFLITGGRSMSPVAKPFHCWLLYLVLFTGFLAVQGCTAAAIAYGVQKMTAPKTEAAQPVPRSTELRTYPEYLTEMERINLEREKAGLMPRPILSQEEWRAAHSPGQAAPAPAPAPAAPAAPAAQPAPLAPPAPAAASPVPAAPAAEPSEKPSENLSIG